MADDRLFHEPLERRELDPRDVSSAVEEVLRYLDASNAPLERVELRRITEGAYSIEVWIRGESGQSSMWTWSHGDTVAV